MESATLSLSLLCAPEFQLLLRILRWRQCFPGGVREQSPPSTLPSGSGHAQSWQFILMNNFFDKELETASGECIHTVKNYPHPLYMHFVLTYRNGH